jgi:hypothetical protein
LIAFGAGVAVIRRLCFLETIPSPRASCEVEKALL